MNLVIFITINILIIIFTLLIVHYLFYKPKNYTFIQFLNNSKNRKMTIRNLILGFTFGVVFGFIDNFGLMIGMNNFVQNLNFKPKIQAALGNTYSDIIGATAGVVASTIVAQVWKIDINKEYNNSPIWITTISIGIGCIIGMLVGNLVI